MLLLFTFLMVLYAGRAQATPAKALEPVNVVIIGDRVADIAVNLGVAPKGLSIRCAMWPKCESLKIVSQVLGCPGCLVNKSPERLPEFVREKKIDTVIIERSDPFCLYMPKVKPEQVAAGLKGLDVDVKYVDFSGGVQSAIKETAKIVGREDKAAALIEEYEKDLSQVQKIQKETNLGKKVVILNGIYQASSGNTFIRAEAPGGYADRKILEPLGCVNVGDQLIKAGKKPVKGCWMVRKLDGLVAASPDVIIMTGDSSAVQKEIAEQLAVNKALSDVPAIKTGALYSMPQFIDSSVIEYPTIFRHWLFVLK